MTRQTDADRSNPTPGQVAYEADVAACPYYHTGQPRKAWADLDDAARRSWERNPTSRLTPRVHNVTT